MKKNLFIAIMGLLLWPVNAFGSDFSSGITQINAAGFPKIEVLLKVFTKQPEELKNDNFSVSEDSQPITSFNLEFRQNRHYMTLVIDRSSSIEPAMNQVKIAAASFVTSMAKDVNLALLSFGSDIDFAHNFSTDEQSLISAINKIKPWGGTALYDALYTACDDLQNTAGRNDLKTVVCLTDGRDSTPNGKTPLSTKTPAQVSKLASDKGIRLITVGLGNDIDVAVLKDFASSTGGWYLQTTSAENLAKLYEALSKRMKLEKYYRLSYATPRPEADGSKRKVEITSSLKGNKDQGTGLYTAPSKQVTQKKPEKEVREGSGSMSVTDIFSSLEIDGPDTVYLTSPIILPPRRPAHGPNGASFLGSTKEECQVIIDQARARLSDEHLQNYRNQQKYLENYSNAIERLQKANDAWATRPDLKDFEKPRIDYRNAYLQSRREEINLYAQQSYEDYLVEHRASMDEMDYWQKVQIDGQPEEDSFFHTNYASCSAALAEIDNKYSKLHDTLEEKADKHFRDTLDSRGAKVNFTTSETTREIKLPTISNHSVSDIKERLQRNTGNKDLLELEEQESPPSDDDSNDNSDNTYDSDDNSLTDENYDSSPPVVDDIDHNDYDNDNDDSGDYDATTKATGKP